MFAKLPSLALAVLIFAGACGGSEPDTGISLPPADGGVIVSQALAVNSATGWIRGFLLAERGQPVRLCEALAESFPPQCGGDSLILRDGVLWREPYSDEHPFGDVTPGGSVVDLVLTTDEPCGYEPDGPCSGMLGTAAGGDVFWTDVAYSVLGTVSGSELLPLQAPPGADL